MKIKLTIITLIAFLLLPGCIKNVLDRKPLNIVPDEDVWKSESLVVIYLVALYDNIPIGFDRGGFTYEANLTDEASQPYGGNVVDNYGNHGLAKNTGMYSWIRKANYFLERIKTSSLTEEQISTLSAECRFIRAYYYFDLVKKYGGMPIITQVQSLDKGLDPLQVKRNKEDEVYAFILTELNEAIKGLPETRDAANSNRATKYTALALKSRAMLYAGSIAKYGGIQLGGLVGIPAQKAATYYREAFDAAQKIIDGKQFALYDKAYDPVTRSGDPAENYRSLFTDKNNKEIIFQKAYANPDKVHNYDGYNVPESFKPGCCGNASAPILEMVESYEYIDGSDGKLDFENKEFDSPADLFKNKDPRFEGTVIYSGMPLLGRTVQIYRGVYDATGRLYDTRNVPFPADPSIMQVGRDGPYTLGDVGKTGFYIKKYISNTPVPEWKSDQNYIDFRYAEILLNYAEAAFEGDIDKARALDAINQVRNRAGIRPITLPELTVARIRNERKVELAFEDKRFWDIRRWRIGTSLFRNTFIHGLWPYMKYKSNAYKYVFKSVSGSPLDQGRPRLFAERDYYSNLADYISSNKNIVNNPGW
jgi:hypothetical protein